MWECPPLFTCYRFDHELALSPPGEAERAILLGRLLKEAAADAKAASAAFGESDQSGPGTAAEVSLEAADLALVAAGTVRNSEGERERINRK